MKHKSGLFKKYYSEYPSSGYIYREVIQAHCQSTDLILDFGAGRGINNWVLPTASIVFGVDVDPVIFDNQRLQEKKLICDGIIPYPDNYFDLVTCTWVVEHLVDPVKVFAEIQRVLKPGGKFIFLTSNKYHYVSLIASITPHWFHTWIIPKIRGRVPDDVYPTVYKANTERSIRRIANESGLDIQNLIFREPPPVYLSFSNITFHIGRVYQKLVSKYSFFKGFRHGIIGVLQKSE